MENKVSLVWLKNKLKNKDFTIKYEDAIDLGDLTDVDYLWAVSIEGSVLVSIKLMNYGGVALSVNK